MQKPSRTSGLSSVTRLAEAREGQRVDTSDAAALDSALDLAVSYRGDVTLHLRSMPRFSCAMIEYRKAVFTSNGSRDAFSTGSRAQ